MASDQTNPAAPDPEEEFLAAEIDDESGDATGAAALPADAFANLSEQDEPAQEQAWAPAPRKAAPVRRKKDSGMKATVAPILITVGALLLIPGFWALGQLTGMIESEREGANTMAVVMLLCWPIALVLIGTGVFFIMQVMKEKKDKAAKL